jgi:hypothetical protein
LNNCNKPDNPHALEEVCKYEGGGNAKIIIFIVVGLVLVGIIILVIFIYKTFSSKKRDSSNGFSGFTSGNSASGLDSPPNQRTT